MSEPQGYFVNWTPLQLALRELRRIYSDPRGLAVMGVVGLVAGLAGPFGTFEAMPQGLRVVYWLVIAFTTYGVGIFSGTLIAGVLLPRSLPQLLVTLAVSVGSAVPVTAVVVAANATFMGDAPELPSVFVLFFYCLVVCAGVFVLVHMILPGFQPNAAARPPAILKRMPPHLRGNLVRIGNADHYVEVHTDKGMSLILMRFSDAMEEASPVPGVQIHRGHWVALEAVRALKRVEGRPVIELASGETLAVSRGQLAAVRAALDMH